MCKGCSLFFLAVFCTFELANVHSTGYYVTAEFSWIFLSADKKARWLLPLVAMDERGL